MTKQSKRDKREKQQKQAQDDGLLVMFAIMILICIF